MRGRLLRALSHLKAAKNHLDEAKHLVDRSYVYGVEFPPAQASLKELSLLVGQKYTQSVINNLKPAKEPK